MRVDEMKLMMRIRAMIFLVVKAGHLPLRMMMMMTTLKPMAWEMRVEWVCHSETWCCPIYFL